MPRLTIGFLILIALTVAGCGSAPAAAPAGGAGGAAVPEASEASGEDGTSNGAGQPRGYAAPAEQRIIKTGQLTLEVQNVPAALAEVRGLAGEVGGYIGGSQAGTVDEAATLTLRIPAARFEETLARLHEMDVTLVSESTAENDVTAQVVDLEARIANMESSEASYRALAERATAVEDILDVRTRLDEVRGEIEQMRAQLENVSGQADLSTLTVTLVPRDAPVEQQTAGWDPGAQLGEAVAALVGVGQGVVSVAIWLGIVVLPVAIIVGILLVIGLRIGAEVRRRLPARAQRMP